MYIRYTHIVQVHPVEQGEPNLYKVYEEHEFAEKEDALRFVQKFNLQEEEFGDVERAVYRGCVNTETGELVDN